MSGSNRKSYLTATTLDQSLLDFSQDNLVCQLEMIAEIETPDGIIYASDRNKYVGDKFYQALLNFPTIFRTLGDWLDSQLEFSTLQLELNNADGRFNKYLPSGANFESWIGKSVIVKLGLRDVESTYFTIFNGLITDVSGFSRSVYSITLVARDNFDKLSVNFPTGILSNTEFEYLDGNTEGQIKPIIYGDWTTDIWNNIASIPGIVVNSLNPLLKRDEEKQVEISIASPAVVSLENHYFSDNQEIVFVTDGALPSPLIAGTVYFVGLKDANSFYIRATSGGAYINTSGTQSGTQKVKCNPTSSFANVKCFISQYILSYFDSNNVYLKRSDNYYRINSSDIVNVAANNNYFEVKQNSVTQIEGSPYKYADNDSFYCRVKGKDLGSYDDNIVSIAEDILKTWGGLVSGDFDSSWSYFRDKSTPVQNAINNIKSRVWLQDSSTVITYVLSLLEQVRLEAFINRDLKFDISSLHFDEFISNPTYNITNFDIIKDSLQPKLDEKININKMRGAYNYLPNIKENAYFTRTYKNQDAIDQIKKTIGKQLVFPNLYKQTDVENQVKESLKLSSSYIEIIETDLTWRSLLKDLGDFVKMNISIGSIQYENVPCLIRKIGYNPQGLKLQMTLWSFQMCPFESWQPTYAGITGGQDATITEE